MAWKYNPFTDALDLTGAGGTSYIDGVVADSSLLPTTLGTPALDAVYLAKAGSGVWLINRKPAGLYVRVANDGDADDWQFLGAFPEVNSDAHFALYNDTTPSKELKFDLSGISASTVRTLTAPDASGTIALTEDFAAPPAIGNTTAGTGDFTTLNVSSLRVSPAFNVGPLSIRHVGGVTACSMQYNGVMSFLGRTLEIGDGGTGGTNQLHAEGNYTLAQRVGTNAQEFRLYNTYTSSTNYERGFLKWDSNTFQIGTEAGSGGGSQRNMIFRLATGRTLFVDSDTIDFRSATFSTLLRLTTTLVQFAGTTSSFPALKRSTTTLQARLADDSAFTAIQGKLTTETAYTAGAPTATGYLVLYDNNGTAYKVPAEAL